jgi:type III secretory pathway component EscV
MRKLSKILVGIGLLIFAWNVIATIMHLPGFPLVFYIVASLLILGGVFAKDEKKQEEKTEQ